MSAGGSSQLDQAVTAALEQAFANKGATGKPVGLGTIVALTGVAMGAAALTGVRAKRAEVTPKAKKLRRGAAILGASVLADSAIEHYRGDFHHKPMYAAPLGGAALIASALAAPRRKKSRKLIQLTRFGTAAVGLAGLGFHARNVFTRPGGLNWNNVFYGAPLGAPGALVVGGLLAFAARPVQGAEQKRGPFRHRKARRRLARGLQLFSGFSLLATSAEAGLLHFRGNFQNPAMLLPVTVPPAAGLALFLAAFSPRRLPRALARSLLRLTQLLGFVGTGFHALGVARNMGGWGNWRQNVQVGPPVPAPISFTGIAYAGEAALELDQDQDFPPQGGAK